jgi:hypothetical protein
MGDGLAVVDRRGDVGETGGGRGRGGGLEAAGLGGAQPGEGAGEACERGEHDADRAGGLGLAGAAAGRDEVGAAVRSIDPSGLGAGVRPQAARAARVNASAARVSSGLPVASAAAVSRSAAAQAMSARPARRPASSRAAWAAARAACS